MKSRKMVPRNLFAGQQWRNRHKEQTCGHGGRGGVGEMYGENSIETCILPYVKQISSPSLMHETGHSKSVHCDNPEGWEGRGVGRELGEGVQNGETHVHPLLIHVDVWEKPPQYCKAISLQLK